MEFFTLDEHNNFCIIFSRSVMKILRFIFNCQLFSCNIYINVKSLRPSKLNQMKRYAKFTNRGTIFMALSVNPRPHSIGPFLGKRLSQMAFAVILPVNRAGIPRTGCSAPPTRKIAFNKP